jgi:hypothetical protein
MGQSLSKPQIRPQYHFRKTPSGLDAWDVRRLVKLSEGLPVKMIDPRQIQELDLNHWYQEAHQIPTPSSLIEHIKLIEACDLAFPIILDSSGRVMDGMHRVCKAVLQNITMIKAVQFAQDPEPDHHNCSARELPYDD